MINMCIFTTLKYLFSKKVTVGVDFFDYDWATDWRVGFPDEFDMSNLQYYRDRNVHKESNRVIISTSLVVDNSWILDRYRSSWYYGVYGDDHPDWSYYSGAMVYSKPIDVHRPGRIDVLSSCPQGSVVPSVWLYDQWDGDAGNDPYSRDGYCYFERDIFETGPSRDKSLPSIFFTAHDGDERGNIDMHSSTLLGWWYNNKLHQFTIVWDGAGFWCWFVDGIMTHCHDSYLHPDIKPKLFATLGVTQDNSKALSSWAIKGIKVSN